MALTIYFSGSITGGRADVALYQRLVAELDDDDATVMVGAVASEQVGSGGESLAADVLFARDIGWIDAADILVAEVSIPSTGVGYEIAYARYQRRIPVIALYRPAHTKRCSAMIAGDRGIKLLEYKSVEELLPRLLESIHGLRGYSERLP
jgi:nucleoside 2-deoxyribosyltransferase